MIFATRTGLARDRGFGLVELMVAVAIGLIAILVITSVFLQSQRQNRTTTGATNAQENSLIALVTLERDIRMAGIGLVGVGCGSVNGFDATLPTPNFSFTPLPVTIMRDDVTGSDVVAVLYGGSPFGNSPTALTASVASSSEDIRVANGNGFTTGDLILISSPPSACSLVRASADATLAGGVWTIPHIVPPDNIFPPSGYGTGARVTNMGAMVHRAYFVTGSSLMMLDNTRPVSAVPPLNPVPVVDRIVRVRAQYGRDTTGDGAVDVYDNTAPSDAGRLVAIRIAVVAQSGNLEKDTVSPPTLTLWSGGTLADGGELALDWPEARRYRYRVYDTVIPLRNVIWNTP
jgi:type IV pilus assembly protein PilW